MDLLYQRIPRRDNQGRKCDKCGKGQYIETSVWDDWQGVLHCSKCGAEIKRHQILGVNGEWIDDN